MVIFMSRHDFIKNTPNFKYNDNLISISTSQSELELSRKRLLERSNPFLALKFEDDETSFSHKQAQVINTFVEDHNGVFIVHCHAGISRSAAVARFIELKKYGKLSPRMQSYQLYNKHVFNVLSQFL